MAFAQYASQGCCMLLCLHPEAVACQLLKAASGQHSCLVQSSGLAQMFHLEEQILLNMVSRLEEGYPDNPYHNR